MRNRSSTLGLGRSGLPWVKGIGLLKNQIIFGVVILLVNLLARSRRTLVMKSPLCPST